MIRELLAGMALPFTVAGRGIAAAYRLYTMIVGTLPTWAQHMVDSTVFVSLGAAAADLLLHANK